MSEINYCQSCGMPLPADDEKILGTNSDASKNNEYCIYCYENGNYTEDCTMEDMIEISVTHMKEMGAIGPEGKTEEETRAMLNRFFPKLKRWQ